MAQNRNGIYGRGHFIRIHHALLNAPAFICLSATGRQVLIDFVGYYDQASDYDKSIKWWKFGIRYTFSMCRFPVGRTAFYDALVHLQTKGFITPHGEDYSSGQPARWLACELWRTYKPGQAELKLLRTFAKKRHRCAENPSQITFDFPEEKSPSSEEARRDFRHPDAANSSTAAAYADAAAASKPTRSARPKNGKTSPDLRPDSTDIPQKETPSRRDDPVHVGDLIPRPFQRKAQ